MTRDITETPIKIWRRCNEPAVIWRFEKAPGQPSDLTNCTFELLVTWTGGKVEHTSAPGEGVIKVDTATGEVTWPYTIAESTLIPRKGARYELARVVGTSRRIWAGGDVVGMGFA